MLKMCLVRERAMIAKEIFFITLWLLTACFRCCLHFRKKKKMKKSTIEKMLVEHLSARVSLLRYDADLGRDSKRLLRFKAAINVLNSSQSQDIKVRE